MLFAILGGVCLVVAAVILRDMLRFRKAKKLSENPTAMGVAAGGVLYVQGNRTYYKMPKGSIRKIADYAMDLRPGSPDMARFTKILNDASEAHAQEVADTKARADEAMRAVAKEEAAK